MKRFLKIFVILLAVVILVGGGVIAYIVATLDTEQVKQQISTAVKEQTGRELQISGDFELSVFPWLGFKIGATRFANRAGFEGDFARFEHAEARVKLLPLLSKQVEMSKLVIDGFNLDLQFAADGANNWQDLAGGAHKAAAPSAGKPSAASAGAAGGIALLLEGVEVRDAAIRYRDARSGASYALTDFTLETGRIEMDRDISFNASFLLDLSEPAVKGTYKLAGVARLERGGELVTLRDLKFTSELAAEGMPFTELRSDLAASLSFDQAAGKVSLAPFRLDLEMKGDQLPKSPLKVAIASDISADLKTMAVSLDKLDLLLPGGSLKGTLAFRMPGDSQQIDFNLASEQLDLNQVMPPAPAGEEQGGSAPAAEKPQQAAKPNPALRKLVVNGDLAIGRVLADKLEVDDVKVRVKMRDGIARLNPVTARVYQGLVQKDVTVDLREAAPKIKAKAEVRGFQVGDYLKATMDKDIISGAADLDADLSMTAADADSIKRSLNGTVRFIAHDGALKGINIPDMIRRAKAALSGQTIPPASKQKTDFSELSASATITDGLVNNPDLSMKSPLLRISGKGTAHLVREVIDYRVTAKLVGNLSGQGGEDLKELSGVPLPIHVTGSFAKPEWELDLKSALEAKVKAEAEGTLKKALENPGKALENPKDLLGDPKQKLKGLKNFFN